MFQSVVFHVAQHPEYPEFSQCVSFDYFSTPMKEKAYNLFCLMVMYFLPLCVITFAYTCILFKILTKTRENKGQYPVQFLNKIWMYNQHWNVDGDFVLVSFITIKGVVPVSRTETYFYK